MLLRRRAPDLLHFVGVQAPNRLLLLKVVGCRAPGWLLLLLLPELLIILL